MHKKTDQKNMTVCVKTIEGKTISAICKKKAGNRKIKDEVERMRTIPRKHQCLVSQGNAVKDEVKIEDYNMKEGTTIEMTLRLQGGMKNDESMASAGIAEEMQVKRRTSEPCSDISGSKT